MWTAGATVKPYSKFSFCVLKAAMAVHNVCCQNSLLSGWYITDSSCPHHKNCLWCLVCKWLWLYTLLSKIDYTMSGINAIPDSKEASFDGRHSDSRQCGQLEPLSYQPLSELLFWQRTTDIVDSRSHCHLTVNTVFVIWTAGATIVTVTK